MPIIDRRLTAHGGPAPPQQRRHQPGRIRQRQRQCTRQHEALPQEPEASEIRQQRRRAGGVHIDITAVAARRQCARQRHRLERRHERVWNAAVPPDDDRAGERRQSESIADVPAWRCVLLLTLQY